MAKQIKSVSLNSRMFIPVTTRKGSARFNKTLENNFENKEYGYCDNLRIAQLLGIVYLNDVKEIMAGDFTLIKYKAVRG